MEEVKFRENNWHAIFARELRKRSSKYEVECWNPANNLRKIIVGENNGIKYRIFPSFFWKFGKEYSFSMINNLKEENSKGKVLIHLHGIHNILSYAIALLFDKIPIVGQHHGDTPPFFSFDASKRALDPLHIISMFLERKALPNIDHFFALSNLEKKYLANLTGKDNIELQTMGVDYSTFNKQDKSEARRTLGLPEEKFLILFVGRFSKNKGTDILIKVWDFLKKIYNIELVMVGGNPRDDLYDLVTKSDIIWRNNLSSVDLNVFYNAVDVLVLPSMQEGFPMVLAESLATNTPVIYTNVGGCYDILGRCKSGISIPPNSTKALCIALTQIIETYQSYEKSINNVFDWNSIINNTTNIYDNLFMRYY
jgi:glycosyltransferase involved in cell wall biosynthesis